MATQAQVEANRQNARKSTGPKTEEGKAASAMNALKHGLTGNVDVVCWEDPADYDRHQQALLAQLQPVGAMEELLAERVVSLSWRAKRARLMQREVTNYVIAKRTTTPVELLVRKLLPKDQEIPKMPQNDPQYAFGRALLQDWADCAIIDRMSHYEKRLEASLYRTINEFKKWRLMRKYEAEMDGEGQRDKDAEGQSREEAKPAQCAERSQSDARAREPSVGSLPAGASRGTHGQDAHATSVCKTNPIPMTSEEQRDAAVETQDFASPRSHDGQESSQASVDAPACKTNPIPMTSAEQTDAAVETQNLASPRSHDAQETFQASVDAPPCKTDPIGEGLSGRG